MKTTKKLFGAMVGTALCLSSSLVQAAESLDFDLEEMVVTASRVETGLTDTPANISVVGADKIEERNYRSVAEALEDVPGVLVTRKSSRSEEQFVRLNGDDRVLIMVDGRRLNLEKGQTVGRAGISLNGLPQPEAIERIEVLKGAGSSLYGSDAVGGVINIITKSGKDKPFIKAGLAAGSWGKREYQLSAGGREHGWGYFITAGKSEQDYLRYKDAGDGAKKRYDNTAYDDTAATVKLEKELSAREMLTLYYEHSFNDGGRPSSPLPQFFYSANSWGKDLNNNASLRYDWGRGESNNGYVRVFRNYYDGRYHSDYADNHYRETKDGADVQQAWKLNDSNQLVAGAEWHQSDIENDGTYGGLTPKLSNRALYVEDQWKFAPTWQLNAGLRYDRHSNFGGKTTSSVALNKKLTADSNAYISWGQVFNAPTANDLYWDEPTLKGNPNLKAESGDVLTVGYNTKLAARTDLAVNYFSSRIKDAIDWVDDGFYNYNAVNIDRQKKQGSEISLKHTLSDKYSLEASYTYLQVKNDDAGAGYKRDLNVKPNQYRFGVQYRDAFWKVGLTARGANGQAGEKYGDESYITFDLSAKYNVNSSTDIFLKLYNLNNAAYAEQGGVVNGSDAYPMPSRSYIVGVNYKF